jgi:hypothetical protein
MLLYVVYSRNSSAPTDTTVTAAINQPPALTGGVYLR